MNTNHRKQMCLSIAFAISNCSVQALELGSFPHLHPFEGQEKYCWFSEGEFQGVCTREGKEIIPANYSAIFYVGDNRFITQDYSTGSRRQLLFNEFGKRLYEFPDWFSLGYQHFHEGIFTVASAVDENVAYIDLNGKYVVPPGRFNSGKDFFEGFASVSVKQKDGICNCGYIDHRGVMRFGLFHDSLCSSFASKYAVVHTYPADKRGLLNIHGRFELPQEYDLIQYQNDKEIIARKNGQSYKITLNEMGLPSINPIEEQQQEGGVILPKPLRLSKEQFDGIVNLLVNEPAWSKAQAQHVPVEIYDIRRRMEVLIYLQKTFGFVGMSRHNLEKKLGKGQESMDKTIPLPSRDSRYLLLYGITQSCLNSRLLYFSINSSGNVDGWSIIDQPCGAHLKLNWHTTNDNQ